MRSALRKWACRLGGLLVVLSALPLIGSGAEQDQQASRQVVSADDFMTSPFAEYFRADDYDRALEALKPFLDAYPNDPVVLRYQAMTLDRLGRSTEAVAIYQRLLAQDSEHIPTRLFLGHAYERLGNRERAVEEWRWVAKHSPEEEYRRWAEEALARSGGAVDAFSGRKRWTLLGDVGWDWDSNVILKPSDKALATTGDQNAGRFSIDLGLRYRALAKPDAQVDLLYTSRQSLHDDSLDDFNFTSQEFGIDARQRVQWAGREVILGGRYGFFGGFLESDLFALSNRWLLSADTRLTPQTRTIVADQFTVSDFGADGSNPPQTSRDGVYNDVSLTQYFYTSELTRYVFARQEYNTAWTRGANYDRHGATTRIGAHSPLLWRTDADVSTGFAYHRYPRFTSLSSLDTARRRDTTWDLAAALTHYLSPKLALRLQYQWINALNRNDLFEYDRQVVGLHALFTQSF